MSYLFLAGIGPVQDFIASARRSRDLWFGSWLLSELAKAAAQAIADLEPPESLIFPAPTNNRDLLPATRFNVANKILARVNHAPEAVAAAAETALRKRLSEIGEAALRHVHGPLADRETALAQIADLVEFFWVALPLPSQGTYKGVREQLEGLMAARKVTREFGPVPWGSAAPKSSLDGQRESVIPEGEFDTRNERELFKGYGVRKGERLDGVGLLKRHGERGEDSRFFSTSHVAALPLLRRLTADKQPALDAFVAALRGLELPTEALGDTPGDGHSVFGHYDGHLLFEERLAEYLEPGRLGDARRALAGFLKAAFDKERPAPYYALVAADGDHMGRAIDNVGTSERHRALSQQLSTFAGVAREIVRKHDGWLIYGGGDDVLSFLPLHTVLPCVAELAVCFAETMKDYPTAQRATPTLSAGVAVCHHLEPLSDALDLARGAEREAKKTRNALAVTVSKRSGADRTVAGAWGVFDVRLASFIRLHGLDAVPDGAAYELQHLARQLTVPEHDPLHATLTAGQVAEAGRILKRKQPKHGVAKEIAEAIQTELNGYLTSGRITVAQLASELIVARIFADALRQAGSEPAKEQEHADMAH